MKLRELVSVALPDVDLTEDVYVGADVLSVLDSVLKQHIHGTPVLLGDPDTFDAAGLNSSTLRMITLPKNPKADVDSVQWIASQLSENESLVAVGSGTVNDLAKQVSTMRDKPYVCVGTAASMNGYTSGIAALLDNGLKTTTPARPPRAVILDTRILAKAPSKLTQAGFGDLISKPVSDTDWWLASQLGEAEYSSLPSLIVGEAITKATRNPKALREAESLALGQLGEALILSGVAMVAAGSSSPASGGEHLISHLWDMENILEQRPTHLHGAQVGVTTCISASLYELVCRVEDPKWVQHIDENAEKRRLLQDHPPLYDTLVDQAMTKHRRHKERLDWLKNNWSGLRTGLLAREIPSPRVFLKMLFDVGAPLDYRAFGQSRQDMRRSLSIAKDIRNRFTVLDLAWDLQILPCGAESVLTNLEAHRKSID